MGISKIGVLFASNVDSVLSRGAQQQQPASKNEESESRETSPATDAVVLSRSLAASRYAQSAGIDSARAERLQKLKAQVGKGDYHVDSERVAVAVLKDIL
jgi:flagellar biosynthesis anti-sigma factor FlgM